MLVEASHASQRDSGNAADFHVSPANGAVRATLLATAKIRAVLLEFSFTFVKSSNMLVNQNESKIQQQRSAQKDCKN